jgi:hypothetical protein
LFWLLKRCIRDDPGWLPIPSSVRYHALALSLRVGGGTILPTRRRRGRSTPAPAALDHDSNALRRKHLLTCGLPASNALRRKHLQPSRGDYSHRTPESPESTTVTFAVAEAGLVVSLGRRARLDDGGACLRLLSSHTSTAPAIDLTGSRKFPVSEDSSLCLCKAASRAESMCGFWVASDGMPCRFF